MRKNTGHRFRLRRRRRPPPSPTTSSQVSASGDEDDPCSAQDEVSGTGSVRGSKPTNDKCSRTAPTNPSLSVSDAAASYGYSTATETGSTSALSSSTTTVAGYISVAPLPVFHGLPSECAVSHLSRFARVCHANNAFTDEEAARIFPVTLDGEAALWYELVVEPLDSAPSWPEVRALFLEVYSRPEDELRAELVALRQGDGERVYAYWLRMQWILRRWPGHGVPEEVVRGIFLDGMTEELRGWVAPQRPTSTVEARKLAVAWEQASARPGREARCGFCGGRHEESGCDVRRKMRELWLGSRDGHRSTDLCGNVDDDLALRPLAEKSSAGVEREEKESGMVSLLPKSGRPMSSTHQCMCWKHQCWKKRFDRSATVPVQRTPAAE